MSITELIHHPERMDRDTLYELRSLLALYPYYQNARLLLLQNLYLLHDPTFDEELRRAAIYISDRSVIFQMIEAGHYQLMPRKPKTVNTDSSVSQEPQQDSRTLSLIDDFLDSLPREDGLMSTTSAGRKPTPIDATVDYVAYLLETEYEQTGGETPELKGQTLIDDFIEKDKGRIVLSDKPLLKPELDAVADVQDEGDEEQKKPKNDVNTESMARIYMKQGNYSRALEIIKQLNLENPKKNIYFADQIRFLEKLIINNNKNKK